MRSPPPSSWSPPSSARRSTPIPSSCGGRRARFAPFVRRRERDRQPGGDGEDVAARLLGLDARGGPRADHPDDDPRPEHPRAAGRPARGLGARGPDAPRARGRPAPVGPYESVAKPVSELDSLGLARLVAADERWPSGRRRDARDADRIPRRGRREPARRHGRAPGAEGRRGRSLLPDRTSSTTSTGSPNGSRRSSRPDFPSGPRSSSASPRRAARACSSTCTTTSPAIEVDDATFARMDGLEGDEAKAAGIEIAIEIVQRLRATAGRRRRARDGSPLGGPGRARPSSPARVSAAAKTGCWSACAGATRRRPRR